MFCDRAETVHGTLRLLYLSHLLYGICVKIFIMNRYISKSYTTSKNTIDRQYTEQGQLPGGALPYMGYIGMCRYEGYGFQAVYSRIGYINQSVWV